MGAILIRDGNRMIGIMHVADVYEFEGWIFEFSKMNGPMLCRRRDMEPYRRQPSENHPFWKSFDQWMALDDEHKESTKLGANEQQMDLSKDPEWERDGNNVRIPIPGKGAVAVAYCGTLENARKVVLAPKMIEALEGQVMMMANLISDCRQNRRLDPGRIAENLSALKKDVQELVYLAKGKPDEN